MPTWQKTLDLSDVFRGAAPFAERRDVMVARLRTLDPNDGELQDICDDLAETTNGDEWDRPWDDFYDWADSWRVWVVTR